MNFNQVYILKECIILRARDSFFLLATACHFARFGVCFAFCFLFFLLRGDSLVVRRGGYARGPLFARRYCRAVFFSIRFSFRLTLSPSIRFSRGSFRLRFYDTADRGCGVRKWWRAIAI